MTRKFIQSELFVMIGKDEEILWQGKPDKLCFILEAIFNPLLVFALIWAAIDFSFISVFLSASKNGSTEPFVRFAIIFFLIHLMPVWLYIAGVLSSFIKYKNTMYAVTNKGIYCSGGVFSKTFEHKPFTELSHINLHRGIFDQCLGVGDVISICNHDGYNTRQHHSTFRGINICDIREYEKVYRMIKDLQTDIYSDTMYPNDLRPEENHGYKTKYTKRQDWQ